MKHGTVDETMDELYWRIYKNVKDNGILYDTGNSCGPSVEVRPGCFTLTDPRRGLYSGVGRRLNYGFFAIEVAGYLAGRNDSRYARLIARFNSKFEQYIDKESGRLIGAYGPAIARNLPIIAGILERDKYSRQAVCSLWNDDTASMLDQNTKCTCSLHFLCERINEVDKLSLHVYMRSNDINWGVPYDVAAFTFIQCVMADCLGMEVGHYYHTAGSLHYYTASEPRIIRRDEELAVPPYPKYDMHKLRQGASQNVCNMSTEFYALTEVVINHLEMRPTVKDLILVRHDESLMSDWMLNMIKFRWSDRKVIS